MLLGRIGARVSRETSVFVATFTIVLGLVLVAASFLTAHERVTRFGTALMPDFAAMYLAGEILNDHGPTRLYDFPLQEEVRRAQFPQSPAAERLPYVYAPWFAWFWRPFAMLPYEAAGALWLATSLAMMLAGFACLARACPEIARRDMALVALVALSFEPFLFECWANGQVSSFPFLCVSAALALERSGRPVAAGMVLALLTYKPMQPPLLFALLLLGARWRTLAGIALGGLGLFAISAALHGPAIVIEYPQRLLEYGRLVSPSDSGGAQLRLWKYTDLQTAARLLGPPLESMALVVAVPVALYFLGALVRLWRRSGDGWADSTRHAWAATLVLLPVLNFYFAVYDVVIAIPGVLLAATLLVRRDRLSAPAVPGTNHGGEAATPVQPSGRLPDSFLGVVALVYLAGLLTPTFGAIRVNLLTLALLVLGWYVLRIPGQDGPAASARQLA
ncbi:MAG: glycosyltransferase family 87 protein [Candidatus Binatia bacterium]